MADIGNRFPRRVALATLIGALFELTAFKTASAVTLLVTECDDGSSSGTLRNTISAAPDNSIVQIPLKCSRITLTQGSIKVPVTLTNIYIVGQSPSETIIDGGAQNQAAIYDRVFLANNAGVLGLSQLTVTNAAYGGPDNLGGCILANGSVGLNNAVVTHCQILPQGNMTAAGGGIYARGSVALLNSEVTKNYALAAPGKTSRGGGIYALKGFSATSSTISGNVAFHGDGGGVSYGGGFCTVGLGATLISRSTISGNVADANSAFDVKSSSSSGGVSIVSSTIANNVAAAIQTAATYVSTTVTDSTIAYNHVYVSRDNAPSGLYSAQPIVANNSIFASNSTDNGDENDVFSHYSLRGSNNLVVASSNAIQLGTLRSCPKLGHLSNNGGPTQTIPLLKGSPALDVGAANGQTTDQRGTGFPRTVGSGTDIGAYERPSNTVDDVVFFSEFDGLCS